jgi:hypothetical protein
MCARERTAPPGGGEADVALIKLIDRSPPIRNHVAEKRNVWGVLTRCGRICRNKEATTGKLSRGGNVFSFFKSSFERDDTSLCHLRR